MFSGALGGALSVIGWGGLNTCTFLKLVYYTHRSSAALLTNGSIKDTAFILGTFRNNHRQCHTVIDMAFLVGGKFLKELVSALYLIG